MKDILLTVLISAFVTLLSGCEPDRFSAINNRVPTQVQANAGKTPPKPEIGGDPANTSSNENSFECVRAEPEPIIKKEVFPKTAFRLEKNKEFPFENLGYETVEFENGDKLLIENIGCENYTLIINFETGRFEKDENDVRFWYETAVKLIEAAQKGIREPYLVKNGVKALKKYVKTDDKPEFSKEINFGGTEIKDIVIFQRVEKLDNGRYKVKISFGTGPL